ncbi:histone-lysine N-methyltransferase SETMAR [Trichonephila clavipes]|nr:histone-lysine N-methyltransferase SETMAR [Trichonephila clavipes]
MCGPRYYNVFSKWPARSFGLDIPGLQHLLRYRNDDDDFLKHIVAGDETWCPHFHPKRRSVSMQWKHPDWLKPRKVKAQKSAGKIILTAIFRDPYYWSLRNQRSLINAQRYTQSFDRLHTGIKNKCPSMLSPGVIILHDNAKPHAAKVCV